MSSLLERDAGFCSGSSEHEDDHDHSHDGLHSPTDASEDSVEVKFTPILKNKRKSSEPSRVVPDPEQGPIKKRFRYSEQQQQLQQMHSNHLHRPWALAAAAAAASQIDHKPNPADILLRHPGVTTLHRAIGSEQEEPLALIAKKPSPAVTSTQISSQTFSRPSSHGHENSLESLIKKTQINRLQPKALNSSLSSATSSSSSSSTPSTLLPQAPSAMTSPVGAAIAAAAAAAAAATGGKTKSAQRNYKNMTRERRIEANARERTRVHTISAAYDTLRHAIPSYSSTQKLSKLSVLRVACSYILTLSRLAGEDFSIDQSEPDIGECVDAVTRTIQTEGKLRRKKDD
jgi:atonal protein 8